MKKSVEEIRAMIQSAEYRSRLDPELLAASDRLDALKAAGASSTPAGREKMVMALKELQAINAKLMQKKWGNDIPSEVAEITALSEGATEVLLNLVKRDAPS